MLFISRVVTNMITLKMALKNWWSTLICEVLVVRTYLPYNENVNVSIKWEFWVHEYNNKTYFKIKQSIIALKQTLTLTLGVVLHGPDCRDSRTNGWERRGREIVLGTLLKLPVVDKSHCSKEIHINAWQVRHLWRQKQGDSGLQESDSQLNPCGERGKIKVDESRKNLTCRSLRFTPWWNICLVKLS